MTERTRINPEYRGCINTSGSDMAEGVFVILKATPTHSREITLATAATDPIYGVTCEAIADGEPGDVQIRGQALVLAGGATAAAVRVTSTAAGKTVAAVAGNAVAGLSASLGVLDEMQEVELSGPGGAAMP